MLVLIGSSFCWVLSDKYPFARVSVKVLFIFLMWGSWSRIDQLIIQIIPLSSPKVTIKFHHKDPLGLFVKRREFNSQIQISISSLYDLNCWKWHVKTIPSLWAWRHYPWLLQMCHCWHLRRWGPQGNHSPSGIHSIMLPQLGCHICIFVYCYIFPIVHCMQWLFNYQYWKGNVCLKIGRG